jgi:hypothetical protein
MRVTSRSLPSTHGTPSEAPPLRFYDAMANSEAYKCRQVANFQLRHDAAAIRIDTARLDAASGGNLLARPAFDDQLQNLSLARTKPTVRTRFRVLIHLLFVSRRQAVAESANNSRDTGELSVMKHVLPSLVGFAIRHGIARCSGLRISVHPLLSSPPSTYFTTDTKHFTGYLLFLATAVAVTNRSRTR